MNRASNIALHYQGRQSLINAIAKTLQQTPHHLIDNVVIEALSSIKVDNKVLSELIIKAREKIKESPERYVYVNKDVL